MAQVQVVPVSYTHLDPPHQPDAGTGLSGPRAVSVLRLRLWLWLLISGIRRDNFGRRAIAVSYTHLTALIGLPTGVVAVNGSTNYNAVFATWNGTSIEHGSPYKFNIGNPSNYVSGTRISDNEILLAYADTGNSNYGTTTILEISGNQIAGSFLDNSKDAIALESGEGGDTIKTGFGGYCACEGMTAGQTIDSEGVTAYSPLDGWLEIKDP